MYYVDIASPSYALFNQCRGHKTSTSTGLYRYNSVHKQSQGYLERRSWHRRLSFATFRKCILLIWDTARLGGDETFLCRVEEMGDILRRSICH